MVNSVRNSIFGRVKDKNIKKELEKQRTEQ